MGEVHDATARTYQYPSLEEGYKEGRIDIGQEVGSVFLGSLSSFLIAKECFEIWTICIALSKQSHTSQQQRDTPLRYSLERARLKPVRLASDQVGPHKEE